MSLVYVSWLATDETKNERCQLKVQTDSFTLSLAPSEAAILPKVEGPFFCSFAGSNVVPLLPSVNGSDPFTLTFENGVECRILLVASVDFTSVSDRPGNLVNASVLANSPGGFALLQDCDLAWSDAVALAVATFMTIDKAIISLSQLAMGSAADWLNPHSSLSAFLRALFRTYMRDEIRTNLGPILSEVCEEAVSLSTKSLADQTTFASLAVRILTAAVDLVAHVPNPFCIALEEAVRVRVDEEKAAANVMGALLVTNLVSTIFLFPNEFQVPSSPDSMSLLVRLHSVLNQAIRVSIEETEDGDPLVRGLGMDLKNRSNFDQVVARCVSSFTQLPSKVADPAVFQFAAMVLQSVKTSSSLDQEPAQRQDFRAAVENFQKIAFSRESTPERHLHYFHQYHLHTARSTHHNAQFMQNI